MVGGRNGILDNMQRGRLGRRLGKVVRNMGASKAPLLNELNVTMIDWDGPVPEAADDDESRSYCYSLPINREDLPEAGVAIRTAFYWLLNSYSLICVAHTEIASFT